MKASPRREQIMQACATTGTMAEAARKVGVSRQRVHQAVKRTQELAKGIRNSYCAITNCVYPNLRAELLRLKWSPEFIASLLEMETRLIYNRLSGRSKFKLHETFMLRDVIYQATKRPMTVDYLFTRE